MASDPRGVVFDTGDDQHSQDGGFADSGSNPKIVPGNKNLVREQTDQENDVDGKQTGHGDQQTKIEKVDESKKATEVTDLDRTDHFPTKVSDKFEGTEETTQSFVNKDGDFSTKVSRKLGGKSSNVQEKDFVGSLLSSPASAVSNYENGSQFSHSDIEKSVSEITSGQKEDRLEDQTLDYKINHSSGDNVLRTGTKNLNEGFSFKGNDGFEHSENEQRFGGTNSESDVPENKENHLLKNGETCKPLSSEKKEMFADVLERRQDTSLTADGRTENDSTDEHCVTNSDQISSGVKGDDTGESRPKILSLELDELRQVFDAVDEEGSGTVKISRILQLAGMHLGHSHQSISEMLQTTPDEVISFEQFCDTVSAILRSDEAAPDADSSVTSAPLGPAAPPPPSPPSSPHQFPEPEIFANYSDDRDQLPASQPATRRRKQPIRSRTFVRTRSLPAPTFNRSNTPPYLPSQHNSSPPSPPRSSPLYHSPYSSSPPAGHTLLEEEDLHSRMRGEETGSPSSLSEVDSAIGGSTTSPGSCRKANSGSWSVNGEREEAHYESYGAAEDGCVEGGPVGSPQPTSLPPVTLGHRNSWVRRSLRVAPSTTQEATVAPRRWGSFRHGGRRIGAGGTAAGAAQQLFRSPSFSAGRSPGGGGGGGGAFDVDDLHSDVSMEDDVHDLMNQVKQLQNRVEVLGDTQTDSQDRIVRVKQENSVLQERVVVLEEQLREAEHRAEDRLAEEQRRNRELIQRVEREKTLTVENYAIKQEHLEKTNQRLEEEVQRLRAKADRHQRERNELENSLSEAQILVANLKEENKLLVSQSKKELQEDQEQSAKVIEELRAEVERLTAVLETTGRKRVPSTDSITASTDQLTAALTSLRQENKSLEEQVEELQAQLLTRGLEEGRELITAAANESLAAEFDAMTQEEVELKERETVEELQKSLHDVQEANKQLRTYIDGILLNIVENHPQLLEVKRKSS